MEQQLIKRASAGDLTAFATLVEKYSGFLMAVVLPILRDPHLAEDILQESFLQMFRSIPNYRGGNFKSWLGRIAVNKALDWKRKEKRRCREDPLASLDKVAEDRSQRGSVEEEVIRGDTYDRFLKILNELPQDYRQILTAFYLDGKNYQQLAAEEGLTVKAIETRLYRARKMIKAKWEGD